MLSGKHIGYVLSGASTTLALTAVLWLQLSPAPNRQVPLVASDAPRIATEPRTVTAAVITNVTEVASESSAAADSVHGRAVHGNSSPAGTQRQEPDTVLLEVPGSDMHTQRYPLARADIERLAVGDRIELPDPEGGWIDLEVENVRDSDSSRTLRLVSNGLVSTMTIGDMGFFGTVSTPRGVYGIASSGTDSLLIDQRVLERRANPHLSDYEKPPVH